MIFFIFLIMFIPQGFAESISNEIGSIAIDEVNIEISRDLEHSLKIYGIINPELNANKGHIQITLPDGDTKGGLFIPDNNGYFEWFFDINNKSQLGNYKIFATYGNQIIGSLIFSVSEKQFTINEIKELRQEISKIDQIREAEALAAEEAKALAAEEAKALDSTQIKSSIISKESPERPLHEKILEGILTAFLAILVMIFLAVYFLMKIKVLKISKGIKLFGIQIFSPYSFDGKRRAFNQATKNAVLIRQNYTCNICGRTPENWDFDHIGSRADNSVGNCQALCLDCHRNKTRFENR